MLRRARRFVTVTARPAARRTWWSAAGCGCELVGAPFEGDGYYVTRVCAHLRPRARAAHPVRGRARHRERGGVMALPAPADGVAPGYFGVYPALVTDIVDPDCLGRVAGAVPVARHRRRPGRARLGDPVHAVRRRRPGPGDPARGGQPGGGGLRGRATCAGPTSSAPPGTARPTLPHDARSRPTTSGCCAPAANSRLEFDDTAGAAEGHASRRARPRGGARRRRAARSPSSTRTAA